MYVIHSITVTIIIIFYYFKPHVSKSVNAPPIKSLFFTRRRRSKNVSYPSMLFNCVDVRFRLSCKFKSINKVSVNNDCGNGCGFVVAFQIVVAVTISNTFSTCLHIKY